MSVTINENEHIAVSEMQQTILKHLRELSEEQLDDFCELAEIYKTDKDPEILETMAEILWPDSIGAIEFDAGVTKQGAEQLNKYQQSIGSRIKGLRVEKGWSQAKLGEQVGLTQSHVCRIERGVHAPTDLTIGRFAKAFGVPASQIDPGCD